MQGVGMVAARNNENLDVVLNNVFHFTGFDMCHHLILAQGNNALNYSLVPGQLACMYSPVFIVDLFDP
jgi:hypothetical protein